MLRMDYRKVGQPDPKRKKKWPRMLVKSFLLVFPDRLFLHGERSKQVIKRMVLSEAPKKKDLSSGSSKTGRKWFPKHSPTLAPMIETTVVYQKNTCPCTH